VQNSRRTAIYAVREILTISISPAISAACYFLEGRFYWLAFAAFGGDTPSPPIFRGKNLKTGVLYGSYTGLIVL
jgi:hypothetical protein